MLARFLIITLVWVFPYQRVNSQAPLTNALTAKFDQVLATTYKADGPGCAVLVAKGGKPVYLKAFGMANIELGVPMQPDMVFRIGSITKQFTAIAILQLVEQGKLNLQDEITKFLPDYPVKGKKILVEHLLTHTSGIRSYTSMPEFGNIIQKDMKPEELVAFFKDQPMDFEPGSKFLYNNSGYFLLGMIIEKVSGMTYPDYLEKHIFTPLGMRQSYYGNDSKLIPKRAAGYQQGKDGVVNADPMSMTLPYAAGSIQSTVEDLFRWHKAVHSYQLVKKESLQKAFSSYRLTDGSMSHYGYGWSFGNIQNSRTIEHGGGINGFLTNAVYLPDEDVFVVIFSNTTSVSPEVPSAKLAALAIDKPYREYKEIKLDMEVLGQYPGVYENDKGETRTITLEAGKLYSQRTGGSRFQVRPYAKDEFYFDNSLSTLLFRRKDGKITHIDFHSTEGRWDEHSAWKRTDKPVPVKEALRLTAEELEDYTGVYELAPNFTITITREADALFGQATGQPRFELFAEKADHFFLKVVEAKLSFVRDAANKVSALVLDQGGRKMEGKKVK